MFPYKIVGEKLVMKILQFYKHSKLRFLKFFVIQKFQYLKQIEII